MTIFLVAYNHIWNHSNEKYKNSFLWFDFCAVPAKFVVGTGKLPWGRLQDFPKYGKFFRLKCELRKTAGSHISPFCKLTKFVR